MFNYQGVLLLEHQLATGCHRGPDPDPDHFQQSARQHLSINHREEEVKRLCIGKAIY